MKDKTAQRMKRVIRIMTSLFLIGLAVILFVYSLHYYWYYPKLKWITGWLVWGSVSGLMASVACLMMSLDRKSVV